MFPWAHSLFNVTSHTAAMGAGHCFIRPKKEEEAKEALEYFLSFQRGNEPSTFQQYVAGLRAVQSSLPNVRKDWRVTSRYPSSTAVLSGPPRSHRLIVILSHPGFPRRDVQRCSDPGTVWASFPPGLLTSGKSWSPFPSFRVFQGTSTCPTVHPIMQCRGRKQDGIVTSDKASWTERFESVGRRSERLDERAIARTWDGVTQSLGTRRRVVKPFAHQPSTAIKRLSRQNSRAPQLAETRQNLPDQPRGNRSRLYDFRLYPAAPVLQDPWPAPRCPPRVVRSSFHFPTTQLPSTRRWFPLSPKTSHDVGSCWFNDWPER
ncbi:hypothetical protein JMJ77_0007493 [Colletotrichum scovillei]|uniref:Uncharacterized protein n=1 Tax=Colletotrichum scovillei TaxID=1209932 RepID=A0A9P7RG96_9PEZI|nr:hypothetical protein JMJ77_0007493 [Colletotrichum scovillei]KAG7074442.1 hypothetical protein JMJ76_0010921 [Colletotrichum scovillei]KAG7081651.1 hypothetical protein JMJ78_0003769 [Colletotrichum scovillei]